MKPNTFLCLLGIFLIGHSTLYAQTTESQITFTLSHLAVPGFDNRELGIAVHAISFIDADGQVLHEIEMGNKQANILQDEGWYHNETLPIPGLFQWTGRNGIQSSIRLPVPEGAEGLMLYIRAVQDSIWMDVALDGQPLASRRVDQYWHSSYIPLEAIPNHPMPSLEPEWLPGRAFPKFPQGDIHYGFRVRTPMADGGHATHRQDWRVNQSFDIMMALSIVSMQGLINRHGSRIYVEWYDPPWFEGQSKFDESRRWRNIPQADPGLDAFYHLDGLSTVSFLFQRFGNHFQGAVVYDPDIPETINLATMIAGIERRIMLAPEQLAMPGMPDFGDVYDLRPLVQQQGWDNSNASRVAIYQWAYDNLWPHLDKHQLGVMSPGPPSYQPIDADMNYYKLNLVERDFLIATKTTALWLSPVDGADTLLLEQYIDDAHQPPILTGVMWNYELPTVDFVSRRGGWVSGHTWPETYTDANLSFWASYPDPDPYVAEIRPEAIWATFGSGPIVMLHSSDGDALFYQMQKGFQTLSWDQSHRQHFGWTMNPTLIDMAPPIWAYYNENREKASLMGGISGVGYAYPSRMNPEQLGHYLSATAEYYERSGLRVVHVSPFDGSNSWQHHFQRMGKAYYDALNGVGYLGLLAADIGGRWNFHFHYPERPTPIAWTGGHGNLTGNNLDEMVQDMLQTDSPDVIHFQGENLDQPPGLQVLFDEDAQEDSTLFIPSSFPLGSITGLPRLNLPPGDYTLHLRMKVENNNGNEHFMNFLVQDLSTSVIHTNIPLSPNDFDQAGQYQDFTVSFSLDAYAYDLSIGFFLIAPQTNLYLDYFRFERTTSSTLPHFTGALIDNFGLGSTDLPNAVTRLETTLARNGGAVVLPEEWFAALNPEYMHTFAEPYLGTGHAALVQAREEMDNAQYMKALITIRKALIEVAPLRIFITENGPLHCPGDDNGTMIVQVTGGTPPYSYQWNTPLGLNNIAEGLSAGTYTVTVTDGNGNSQSASHHFSEPPPVTTDVDVLAGISCLGFTGQATVAISGGNPGNWLASWNSQPHIILNPNIAHHHSLQDGGNHLQVVDWRGCAEKTIVPVPIAPPLSLTVAAQPDTAQTNVGSVAVVADGGTPPYSYFWDTNPEQRSDTLIGLPSGNYTVTVLDAQGCEAIATASVELVTRVKGAENETSFRVFPNPAQEEAFFEVQLNEPKAVKVALRDIHGRIVSQWQRDHVRKWREGLNPATLEKGVYILQVEVDGWQTSERLVVF